ncbi:MAG: GntR family transcriptional regulator [Candidatus Aminicenantales bacterium]
MEKKGPLNLSSLKEQVYEYLRFELKRGNLKPGSFIKMDKTCEKLGVSKTPLREALLQLEAEGFVTILPRRGVVVNLLSLEEIKDIYQVIGALESTAFISSVPLLSSSDVERMKNLNQSMKKAIEAGNFDLYYEKNLNFHDTYITRAGNKMLKKIVETLKKRLYDFPRPEKYIKEWEEASIAEHYHLLSLLSEKKIQEAARFIREVHWSFEVQKKFIVKYYGLENEDEK